MLFSWSMIIFISWKEGVGHLSKSSMIAVQVVLTMAAMAPQFAKIMNKKLQPDINVLRIHYHHEREPCLHNGTVMEDTDKSGWENFLLAKCVCMWTAHVQYPRIWTSTICLLLSIYWHDLFGISTGSSDQVCVWVVLTYRLSCLSSNSVRSTPINPSVDMVQMLCTNPVQHYWISMLSAVH